MSEYRTHSEAETAAIGERLGRLLAPGDVVLLEGPLGAGKTAFARGLAKGLGADPDEVSSPTFTIVQEYPGTVTVEHVDLYRLTPPEVDDLALEDLMEGRVVAVEWPDRWHRAPVDACAVVFDVVDATTRRITVSGLAGRRLERVG